MLILSIDIGYTSPSFVTINYKEDIVRDIIIYDNISYKNYLDSVIYLKYFISKKPDLVLIENQHTNKNISLMKFFEGYFMGSGINVILRRPIAHLRQNKEIKTRSVKKRFSVELFNLICSKQNLDIKFKCSESDICDAINLSLYYIYGLKKKNEKKNQTLFLSDFNIPISCLERVNLAPVS